MKNLNFLNDFSSNINLHPAELESPEEKNEISKTEAKKYKLLKIELKI